MPQALEMLLDRILDRHHHLRIDKFTPLHFYGKRQFTLIDYSYPRCGSGSGIRYASTHRPPGPSASVSRGDSRLYNTHVSSRCVKNPSCHSVIGLRISSLAPSSEVFRLPGRVVVVVIMRGRPLFPSFFPFSMDTSSSPLSAVRGVGDAKNKCPIRQRIIHASSSRR